MRLLIVQPYVPSYRVPLFTAMKEELSARGIDLMIAAAESSDVQRARGDDYTSLSADFQLRNRQLRLAGREFLWRNLGPTLRTYRPDFLIVEQAIKNVESLRPLLSQQFDGGPQVAMWGQGRSYSSNESQTLTQIKRWLTHRASWFFAYTPMGAEYVVSRGFPQDRVTVLWNSNDTKSLRSDMASLTNEDVWKFRKKWNLQPGKTGLFLGGVDQRKGISFLLESSRLIADSVPGFKLLIAGAGDMDDIVKGEAATGGPVQLLGRVDGRDKALALAASDVLMIPEWIGLVAVDALAAQKPLITTDHPSHSPEIDYLTFGVNAVVTRHHAGTYAQAVVDSLQVHISGQKRLPVAGELPADLSIEAMTSRFVDGVQAWLQRQAAD